MTKKGCKQSEEFIRKRIDARKKNGRPWHSEATKEKISEVKTGRYKGAKNGFYRKHHTEENRRKWSEDRKGVKLLPHSIESRRKQGLAVIGEKNPFFGHNHTKKSKGKISFATAGEKNPNYGVSRTEEQTRKQRASMIGKPGMKGEKNPMYGKTDEKHHNFGKEGCWHHSEEYKRKKSEEMTGDKNFNWIDGRSYIPYPQEFNNQLKEQIRSRDNYRCQECFRHQDELYLSNGVKYKLHIHHIDYDKKNCKPENLISLCSPCHNQTSYKREDWTDYYQKRLNGLD